MYQLPLHNVAPVVPSARIPSEVCLSAETQREIDSALLDRAQRLCPDEYSCRHFGNSRFRVLSAAGISALVLLAGIFPVPALISCLVLLAIVGLSTSALRIAALVALRRPPRVPGFLVATAPVVLPRISLLIPLYQEVKTLPALVSHLNALEYPRTHLEVRLLLEEDDNDTRTALRFQKLPDFVSVLTIPSDWLRTKPKAMNYALPYLTGDIVGIYDAEDRPESDQLMKVATHFTYAAANVACVQGRLDFYNSRDNWIARCFAIDYAMWFRVLLRGVQQLGMPIPLGGTTVFFRKSVLVEIGGWDAHNVTEDADLGMRLARFGYHCEMLDSTTWEEANHHPWRWVRQRSRWLKGYAITWLSHCRDPKRLWRDLGPVRFVGFQIIMLSGLLSHLAAPLFLFLWLSSFGFAFDSVGAVPKLVWWVFIGTMISSEVIQLAVALKATATKEKRHLMPYILTLPFYWPLASIAAYKAIFELIFAPFYWDKTSHGHTHHPVVDASSCKRVS